LVSGVVLVFTAVWVALTSWSSVLASHPIGWITLIAVGLAGLIIIVVALRTETTERRWWVVWALRGGLVVGTLFAVGVLVYTRPLAADGVAIDALESDRTVAIEQSSTSISLEPSGSRDTGLAFYPGAKVDPRAYARILRPVAQAGYPVVILKQPYNLAILDKSAADSVIGDSNDDVEQWVIGGHSLGGAMAASYAETDRDELSGLLLYAAYPVDDMSDRNGLAVMSVSGTNDGLADVDDIDESVAELPSTAEFVRIDGAVHAFFGDYGDQNGDGTPNISREAAQDQIIEATLALMEAVADADRRPT
jgi:hypothetical protein